MIISLVPLFLFFFSFKKKLAQHPLFHLKNMSLKLKPTLEEVQAIVSSGQGNTIPIYAELEADFLTPVSAYLKVADRCDYSFLFESVEGGENISRYSFIGSGNVCSESV